MYGEDFKYSRESNSSTCAGETSSESYNTSDDNTTPMAGQEYVPANWNSGNTAGLQNYAHVEEHTSARARAASFVDDEAAYPDLSPDDMPSTREPSPEPLWRSAGQDTQQWSGNEEYFAAQQRPQRKSSRGPSGMRRGGAAEQQPGQSYQMVYVVPKHMFHQAPNVMMMNQGAAMPFPLQTQQAAFPERFQQLGAPMVGKEPSPAQQAPLPVSAKPAADAPEKKEQALAPKQRGNGRSRGHAKGSSVFNSMSADQKTALCKYVYDIMLQKEFTSPEGYLIVDVFSEVWKDLGDSAEGWRVAQHRFADLLRSAPQYFRLFRRSIRVANQCGWFARKGEKMVRLVLEKEK